MHQLLQRQPKHYDRGRASRAVTLIIAVVNEKASLRLFLMLIFSYFFIFFSSCQIHNRYEGKDISNHKRNLVIAGGVTLSVIVSPVVAAVTVGQSILFFCFEFPGIKFKLMSCKKNKDLESGYVKMGKFTEI